MSFALPPEALTALLEGLHAVQNGLRAALHALGLAPELHGQPAWPPPYRLAAEMLVLDAGLARALLLSLLCAVLAALALLASIPWRGGRWWLWLAALGLLVFAPWPDARLVLAPAVATSLHRSPTGFSAQGIVQGQQVYREHCQRCHGADGRGEGPDAAGLPMWPPTVDGALLWKRLEGELFWRVRHGMQAHDGTQTMPGFGQQLGDEQVWQVLDYLQALAAGRMLSRSGAWARPVRMPDATLRCRGGSVRSVRDLAGQRLRVVLAGADASLVGDPRLTDLVVRLPAGAADAGSDGRATEIGGAMGIGGTGNADDGRGIGDADCRADDSDTITALSLVLGVSSAELPGHQLIVDRSGWLRARGQPGRTAWSESDLVCSSRPPARPATGAMQPDGLDALIRRMDDEPVRLVRGGFPH